jgi:lipoate---protein ligase
MKYLDLTLDSSPANLACDEVLLDLCESGTEGEILRFWESKEYFAVAGYANSAAKEANLEVCNANDVPVLRRLSGGGTVLQGPGCLNFSVILKIPESGPLTSIAGTNRFVMERQLAALAPLLKLRPKIEGCTDLAIGGIKFSGNAQRRKRTALIFHGTFLLDFDLPLIEKYLRMPSKEPDYRQHRAHGDFVTNLGIDAQALKLALRAEWKAAELLGNPPLKEIEALTANKYSTTEWNLKF